MSHEDPCLGRSVRGCSDPLPWSRTKTHDCAKSCVIVVDHGFYVFVDCVIAISCNRVVVDWHQLSAMLPVLPVYLNTVAEEGTRCIGEPASNSCFRCPVAFVNEHSRASERSWARFFPSKRIGEEGSKRPRLCHVFPSRSPPGLVLVVLFPHPIASLQSICRPFAAWSFSQHLFSRPCLRYFFLPPVSSPLSSFYFSSLEPHSYPPNNQLDAAVLPPTRHKTPENAIMLAVQFTGCI